MCGVNGMFAHRSGAPKVSLRELVAVRDYMAKRGPDHAGEWISDDGRVGLGHRRLSIIDLSEAGNQPMASRDGRFWMVFNGEVYNYRELRQELESEGVAFHTQSDTEVVMAIVARDGIEGLARLRGMFALAIWDVRERTLHLARDPLGIKPLYVADYEGTLRFASQVKALLTGDGIDRSMDPAGHVGFFLWGHVPEPYTLYRGIRMLPPGTILSQPQDGLSRYRTFFRLQDSLKAGDGGPAPLREVLESTTRAHFVADVPVSLFLSAGRDSSTLLSLASEVRSEPVHAVTLAFREFEGTENDEAPLAAELAKRYGANHLVHRVAQEEFRGDFGALFEAMDQPSIDGANTYFISKVAASLGVRVALSGVGADEIFGGYASFYQVPKLSRALGWSKGMPWLGRGLRKTASRLSPKSVSPKYAGLVEFGGTIEGAYLLRRGLFMPWELERLLEPDLARAGLEALNPLESMRALTKGLPTAHAKVVALELSCYMLSRLLRDSDWASMAHSLELRTPFVDRDVVQQLGPWIAGPCPPSKDDMARCPVHPAPKEILERPKTGFLVPVKEWLLGIDADDSKEQTWRRWARLVYERGAERDGGGLRTPSANP